MQIKKVTQSVLISISVGDLMEAGIDPEDIIETRVVDGKIIIQNVDDMDNFVCSGDCKSCQFSEIDCDGDCESCPCNDECDDLEVER